MINMTNEEVNKDRELIQLTQSMHDIRSAALEASGSFLAVLGACGPEAVT